MTQNKSRNSSGNDRSGRSNTSSDNDQSDWSSNRYDRSGGGMKSSSSLEMERSSTDTMGTNYDDWSLDRLQARAGDLGVSNHEGMTRKQLVNAIQGNRTGSKDNMSSSSSDEESDEM